MEPIRPYLLAACGNPIAGDDAFGPRVAERLAQIAPPDLEIVNLAQNPTGLLDRLVHRLGLIVVDAALVPAALPGDLLDLDYHSSRQSLPCPRGDSSTHGLGLATQLAIAENLGWLPPRVRLIAAAAGNTAVGSSLSPQLSHAVPKAVITILDCLVRWRNEPDPAPTAREISDEPKGVSSC